MYYNFAQFNIAKMTAPIDDPFMMEFVNNLERIKTLANESIESVWRLEEEEEAKQRLAYYRKHGESPFVFTFKSDCTIKDWLKFIENKSS